MKFTKKLLSVITIIFLGIFYSKETYSKEKKLKTDYSYVTEKIKIYSDENKKENIGTLIKGTRVNVYDTKEIIKKSTLIIKELKCEDYMFLHILSHLKVD